MIHGTIPKHTIQGYGKIKNWLRVGPKIVYLRKYEFFSTLTGFKEFSNIFSDLARLRHIYNSYILICTALDVNIMSYTLQKSRQMRGSHFIIIEHSSTEFSD